MIVPEWYLINKSVTDLFIRYHSAYEHNSVYMQKEVNTMSSIGDKKVALNLSDGTSVNLNKPTVIDSTVTSFLGLKNGEYCGVCTYSVPEYNSNIFRSSIMDFPFPVFRKGTEPGGGIYDNNFYYAECPTDVYFYLKVMDFVGDDNRNTQLYAIQLRGANEDPVAGDDVNFPANGWDKGLYIGRSYYSNPAPASLDDETDSESTEHVENNKIAWSLVPDQVAIKDMLPYIKDYTSSLNSNGVSDSDKTDVASASVADYLADAINLRNLSEGADLNTCLTTGKYVMNGITVVNGPVAVEGADGNTRYADNTTYDDSYHKTTPTMNHAVMTVEYLSMNSNGLIQTIVSDDFSVRRLITGLKNTSIRLLTIIKPDTATTFGPWVSLVEDNLTSTSTVAALSAKQGKELKSLIDDLHIKSIDSSITDLTFITESGTYTGTTDFDKTDADDDGTMYYTSSLTNWPGSIIHTSGAMTAVPYILRVTTFIAEQRGVRTYYELRCVTPDNQKASGNKSNGHINWTNDKISNLTKSDVGLDRVDNTADADKSVNNAGTAQRLATMSDDGGTITAINVGSTSNPVYIDNGIPEALTSTVGSAANPVYMKNGTITAGTYTFSASTTDLTAGSSTLATNEIRFIYE